MNFVSYAQNFEDVMLWRALKHVEKGFYVDVGANDPQNDSVTKAFYDHGWRGINFEPVFEWYEKLAAERSRDINLQLAAGAESGFLTLYEIPGTGLSTIDKKTAEKHEVEHNISKIIQTVPVQSLTEICLEFNIQTIHFLKVDVEGAEQQVLEGLDLARIRPWIILVESTIPSTEIEKYEGWEPALLAGGYEFVYFDGLNRFYIAKEHHYLAKSFELPPNVFDRFSLDKNQTFVRRASSKQHIAQSNAEYLNEKLKEKTTELNASLTIMEEQAVYVQLLESEQEEKNSKIEELDSSSRYWRLTAANLSHELQTVHSSKSWYVTKPFRFLLRLLYKLHSMGRHGDIPATVDSQPASKCPSKGMDQETATVDPSRDSQSDDFTMISQNVSRVYRRLEMAVAQSGKAIS